VYIAAIFFVERKSSDYFFAFIFRYVTFICDVGAGFIFSWDDYFRKDFFYKKTFVFAVYTV